MQGKIAKEAKKLNKEAEYKNHAGKTMTEKSLKSSSIADDFDHQRENAPLLVAAMAAFVGLAPDHRGTSSASSSNSIASTASRGSNAGSSAIADATLDGSCSSLPASLRPPPLAMGGGAGHSPSSTPSSSASSSLTSTPSSLSSASGSTSTSSTPRPWTKKEVRMRNVVAGAVSQLGQVKNQRNNGPQMMNSLMMLAVGKTRAFLRFANKQGWSVCDKALTM